MFSTSVLSWTDPFFGRFRLIRDAASFCLGTVVQRVPLPARALRIRWYSTGL